MLSFGSCTAAGISLLVGCLFFGSQALTQQTPPAYRASDSGPAYKCVVRRPVHQPPPPLTRPSGATQDNSELLRPPCPNSQVPQALGRYAPKGMPQVKGTPRLVQPRALLFYLYDNALQFQTAIGASGDFTRAQPFLAPSDYHSLAELAVESADGKQIVEVGWTVDPSVNGGSHAPHLFIFHWVNGAGTCYNGCGFVQYSSRIFPGRQLSTRIAPVQMAIEHFSGNWWIWYNDEWVGYFPDSLWSGGYTEVGLTQWFGEVAAASSAPCTDMGNGIFGTNLGSTAIKNMYFISGAFASASYGQTNPSYYAIGRFKGYQFRYGGPGAC